MWLHEWVDTLPAPYGTEMRALYREMAAKMFLIAGPVIVFGTAASVVYGVVLWLLGG